MTDNTSKIVKDAGGVEAIKCLGRVTPGGKRSLPLPIPCKHLESLLYCYKNKDLPVVSPLLITFFGLLGHVTCVFC